MSVSLHAILLLCGLAVVSVSAEEAGRVIIEADFSEKAPGGGVLARDLTNAADSISWKLPTLISINPPSTLTVGTEKIGKLEPPFAFFRVSPQAKNPSEVGGAP